MITEDSFFYLPNLHTFQNGNAFYGSYRGLRFYVRSAEQDEAKVFDCVVWYGELCLAESEVVASMTCPFSEEGREQVLVWLDEQYTAMCRAEA